MPTLLTKGRVKSDVPSGQDILPAVWAAFSNIGIELIQETFSNIDTRDVFKCKARINALRGKQTHGVNYWETYSPVVK